MLYMKTCIKIFILLGVLVLILLMSATVLVASQDFNEVKALLLAEQVIINRYDSEAGSFGYDYNIKKHSFSDKDNFVRQMGAVYALGEMVRYTPSYKNIQALKTVVSRKLSDSVYIEKNGVKYRFLHDGNGKIGALSLFLAGALALEKADKVWWNKHSQMIDEMFETVLWNQKQNGDFASYISPDATLSSKESENGLGYFTGETLVALAHRHILHPKDVRVRSAILKIYEYLLSNYSSQRYKGLYLWYMTATDILVRNTDSTFTKAEKDIFARGAINHHNIEKDAVVFVHDTKNTCANTEGLGYFINFASAYVNTDSEKEIFTKSLQNNFALQIKTPFWAYQSKDEKNKLPRSKLRGIPHFDVYCGPGVVFW